MIVKVHPFHPLDCGASWHPHRWFAWRPVRLMDDRWIWLQVVERVMLASTNAEGDDWRWGYSLRRADRTYPPWGRIYGWSGWLMLSILVGGVVWMWCLS